MPPEQSSNDTNNWKEDFRKLALRAKSVEAECRLHSKKVSSTHPPSSDARGKRNAPTLGVDEITTRVRSLRDHCTAASRALSEANGADTNGIRRAKNVCREAVIKYEEEFAELSDLMSAEGAELEKEYSGLDKSVGAVSEKVGVQSHTGQDRTTGRSRQNVSARVRPSQNRSRR